LCGTAFAESRERPQPTYVYVPGAAKVANTTGPLNVSSRLVFLHRCPDGVGCIIKQGTDDSRTDTSSIANGQVLLKGFTQGDDVWNETVACVKKTFEPFNIMVTDQDPGSGTPHFENMVGGRASDLNRSDLQNAGGVAPFDCSEIPNAIVYTFDVYGPDALSLCWTSSQEIAHAFGLDHSFVQKDPMTYLPGDLPKRFRDEEAECGEFQFRACQCGGAKQNSYRKIVTLFGPGAPTPPTITLNRPTDGSKVQPGFQVSVDAQDDIRVEKVEVSIDGTSIGMATLYNGKFWELNAPKDLPQGPHTVEVKATDVQGVPGTSTFTVDEGPPCKASSGCAGDDVCVEGLCVPGPAASGGLGSVCQADTECLSHHCTDGGEALKYCTEACSPGNAASCPSEFECLAAGASGVCWPNPDAGCCDAGTAPQGSILLGLGVGALVIRRRRRRR
jgi:hypothetical protein